MFLWLTVHHLSITGQLVTSICSLSFKKYIGNSQRRKRCCQSLRRAAFMYRFPKSSKFYVGDVAIDDQKRREGNKNWKAQLIKRWSWSGVSLILLSNDLHLFKMSSDISWWKNIKSWFAQRSFSSWGTEWLQMPWCFLQGNPNSQHSKSISFLLNCITIASCIF